MVHGDYVAAECVRVDGILFLGKKTGWFLPVGIFCLIAWFSHRYLSVLRFIRTILRPTKHNKCLGFILTKSFPKDMVKTSFKSRRFSRIRHGAVLGTCHYIPSGEGWRKKVLPYLRCSRYAKLRSAECGRGECDSKRLKNFLYIFLSNRKALYGIYWARILKLFRTPGIDSTESIYCEKYIPLWNWFLEISILCESTEDFRIVVVICSIWEKDTPIGQYIYNTQTIWQLSAEGMKSLFLL